MPASTRCKSENRTGDVSAAIQSCVESQGFYLTANTPVTVSGGQMHEGPQVPNYGRAGTGILLKAGMTVAIEPNGSGWKRLRHGSCLINGPLVSADGSLTAHFEHSVAVTEGEPLILTVL
jgi:methionyl aminopeptidase